MIISNLNFFLFSIEVENSNEQTPKHFQTGIVSTDLSVAKGYIENKYKKENPNCISTTAVLISQYKVDAIIKLEAIIDISEL